jgi:hypothetical protein
MSHFMRHGHTLLVVRVIPVHKHERLASIGDQTAAQWTGRELEPGIRASPDEEIGDRTRMKTAHSMHGDWQNTGRRPLNIDRTAEPRAPPGTRPEGFCNGLTAVQRHHPSSSRSRAASSRPS